MSKMRFFFQHSLCKHFIYNWVNQSKLQKRLFGSPSTALAMATIVKTAHVNESEQNEEPAMPTKQWGTAALRSGQRRQSHKWDSEKSGRGIGREAQGTESIEATRGEREGQSVAEFGRRGYKDPSKWLEMFSFWLLARPTSLLAPRSSHFPWD